MKSKSVKSNLGSDSVVRDLPPALPKPEVTRKRLLELDASGKKSLHPYTPAGSTDVAKTFARIRRQLKENEAALHNAAHTVCELKRKAAK